MRSAQDASVLKGRKYLKDGDYAAALNAFLEFYDRRAALGVLIRRRNSNVVFDLLKLADVYEPAKDAINNLATEIEEEIQNQSASEEDISDWCTIIRHFGELDHAWNLYNSLLENKTENVSMLSGVVYGQLVQARRYAEALPTAIENARWAVEEVDPNPKGVDNQAQLFTYWLPSVYESFEVLLALGENEWCKTLELWAKKIPDQAPIYDGLINAALRAEHNDAVERLTKEKAKCLIS